MVCWGFGSQRSLVFNVAEISVTGWIVARLLADGRIEFGFQPEGGARILPSGRFVPTDAQVDRWLVSSEVELDGAVLGQILARRLPDGRVEIGFILEGGARLLPPARYLPTDAGLNRWLHSSLIGG